MIADPSRYAPFLIVLLVGAVWVLEHFARAKMGSAAALRLGIPLPRLSRSLHLEGLRVPDPLPDHWLSAFVPLGNQIWLLQDDATHWCYAVLTSAREEGELQLTMHRRMPLALPATIAGAAAFAAFSDQDLIHASLVVLSWALIWILQVYRSYRWLGSTFDELIGRVRIFATP